jgi:hypothetical protein
MIAYTTTHSTLSQGSHNNDVDLNRADLSNKSKSERNISSTYLNNKANWLVTANYLYALTHKQFI